jgi:hypothetical protein
MNPAPTGDFPTARWIALAAGLIFLALAPWLGEVAAWALARAFGMPYSP